MGHVQSFGSGIPVRNDEPWVDRRRPSEQGRPTQPDAHAGTSIVGQRGTLNRLQVS